MKSKNESSRRNSGHRFLSLCQFPRKIPSSSVLYRPFYPLPTVTPEPKRAHLSRKQIPMIVQKSSQKKNERKKEMCRSGQVAFVGVPSQGSKIRQSQSTPL